MKCVACGAPLDDDIDLCDECFRVMPVDEMVSASDINDIRNRFVVHRGTGTYMAESETEIFDLDQWASDSGYTRLSHDLYVHDESGFEWSTEALIGYWLDVTTTVRSMLYSDHHAYSPGCHCQECLTERQAMS